MFRDYLREHRDTALAYEAVKLAAAEQHREDRQAYTNAKTEFIEGVLRQAQSS